MNEMQPEMTDKVIETSVPDVAQAPANEKQWLKSKFANLYKSAASGDYFVRAKVCGRLVRKSLKTQSLEIAKEKMDRILKEERERTTPAEDYEITYGQLCKIYFDQLALEPNVPKNTRLAKEVRRKAIETTWPGIMQLRARQITDMAILGWALKIRRKYGATHYNGIIQLMRSILQIAVDRGVLQENPAKAKMRGSSRGIPYATVPLTPPELPDVSQFQKLLDHLDAVPQRARAAKMVRFLAYSGARIGAVRKIMPEDIDMERNEIVLPAIKFETTRTRVPMIPELRALCEELLRDHPGDGPLFSLGDPIVALQGACKSAGLPLITNHDLRHLFATRCIESGVDIRTVAAWLGHRDGGALLMKRYAHLRNEHSQAMASRVAFTSPAPRPPESSTPAVVSHPPADALPSPSAPSVTPVHSTHTHTDAAQVVPV